MCLVGSQGRISSQHGRAEFNGIVRLSVRVGSRGISCSNRYVWPGGHCVCHIADQLSAAVPRIVGVGFVCSIKSFRPDCNSIDFVFILGNCRLQSSFLGVPGGIVLDPRWVSADPLAP